VVLQLRPEQINVDTINVELAISSTAKPHNSIMPYLETAHPFWNRGSSYYAIVNSVIILILESLNLKF